jgi:hypothetical protein
MLIWHFLVANMSQHLADFSQDFCDMGQWVVCVCVYYYPHFMDDETEVQKGQ